MTPTPPPKWPDRFLEWYCNPALLEEIQGDAYEMYFRTVKTHSRTLANWQFAWNVLRFFRWSNIRRSRTPSPSWFMMLHHYYSVFKRSFIKQKGYSSLNIVGLGIGIAAFLLICQYISFELSYDNFHTNSDRIVRLVNDRYQQGKRTQHSTYCYPAVSPAMARELPEVESYARILVPGGETIVKADNQVYLGDHSLMVDEHFLSIFDFPLLIGDRNTVLKEKRTAVLTESIARKYFPLDDLRQAVGKEFYWSNETTPYTVAGICANLPDNSHIKFDILLAYSSLYNAKNTEPDDSWTWSNMRHYILLKPGTDMHQLETKLEAFSRQHFQGDKVTGSIEKFILQPLKDIHLHSDTEYEYADVANGKAVWGLFLAAVIIVVIAFLNYINLTTARTLDRAKEVGIKKALGATRAQLIRQFMTEAAAVGLLACILAVVMVHLFRRPFSEALSVEILSLPASIALHPDTMIIAGVVLLAGIVLSGWGPAILLSSYRPVAVLKGKFIRTTSGQSLRKALVIFQFAASCALVTMTLIVSQQIDYMRRVDLGINIQKTMVVAPPMRDAFDSTYMGRVRIFKNAVRELSAVSQAATSSHTPGDRPFRTFGIRVVGDAHNTQHTLSQIVVDEDFFPLYQTKLLAGRTFAAGDCHFDWNNVQHIVVNRSALKQFDLPLADAVGRQIIIQDKTWTIVGVVENFHQQSLHSAMEPMLFTPDYGTSNPTSIKLTGSNDQDAIQQIEAAFKKTFPDNAFHYSFLPDTFGKYYHNDTRFSAILKSFTALGVLISCLGLIALASYTAQQRTKEIGIRKVLGASIPSIITLLTVDFVKLVLVGTLVAIPLAYFPVQDWLTHYAYHISPGIALYILPIVILLAIAAVTLAVQVFATARTNPVDTLRYE
jgi:putative ABC transport system permease protein